jgi:cysteine desulfurase
MQQSDGIYLDYNATTPCDPRVVEKMLPYFRQVYGNPANGLHRQGRMAAKAVDEARERVAELIGAQPKEIIFTAGATESDNLAILGVARMARGSERKRIVTCAIEHKAVLLPCKKLKEEGYEVVILPVDSNGRISVQEAIQAITPDTLLVSIHFANNEIGVIEPVNELTQIAHQQGALFHSDAAQATGKIPVNVNKSGIDLLSFSSHKLYGPKGIGGLYVRGGMTKIPLEPIAYGGGQEEGLRSGTLNVPAIVGFGEACQIVSQNIETEGERIRNLRDMFEQGLTSQIPGLHLNGDPESRLPNTASLTFKRIEADALLLNLPEVMMGTGSACTSGAIEPSHVLQAIGLDRSDAFSTVRVSLGRFTTEEEILAAISYLMKAWRICSS